VALNASAGTSSRGDLSRIGSPAKRPTNIKCREVVQCHRRSQMDSKGISCMRRSSLGQEDCRGEGDVTEVAAGAAKSTGSTAVDARTELCS
jgi:hypothetical protein